MKPVTYQKLPQLQAFVFTDETNTGQELRNGYRGATVIIKLSDQYMWGLKWPFPTEQDDFSITSVQPKFLQYSVIPVNPGIEQAVIHAAIVNAGYGHLLINLAAKD